MQKAEEAMDASKIQSFAKKNSDDSTGPEKSTQSQLFPHLLKDSPSPTKRVTQSEPQLAKASVGSHLNLAGFSRGKLASSLTHPVSRSYPSLTCVTEGPELTLSPLLTWTSC